MKKTSETIVFFGSGPVAAAALDRLSQHAGIEAVITKPKLVHHQGAVPVIEMAAKHGWPTFTPANRQELSAVFASEQFKSRVGIVIDYGIIITEEVIARFEMGIINSHFSLLPRWRGADPITFSILAGDTKTGVSLMLIEPTLDTGKLLAQRSIPILASDTTATLTDRLVELSDELLSEYLPRYLAGELQLRAQPHPDRATYSRKLTKEDGQLDWHKPAKQLEREIRAYQPWPKSTAKLGGIEVIIIKAAVLAESGTPGDISFDKKKLIVFCGKGALDIQEIKPAGKKGMSAQGFIHGYLNFSGKSS